MEPSMQVDNYTTIDIRSAFHKLTQEIIDQKNTLADLTDMMIRQQNKTDTAVKSLGIELREIEEMQKRININLESIGIRVWNKEDCSSTDY